jgi:hypothetical protein
MYWYTTRDKRVPDKCAEARTRSAGQACTRRAKPVRSKRMTCRPRVTAGVPFAAVGPERLYHRGITENDVLSNGISISYPYFGLAAGL